MSNDTLALELTREIEALFATDHPGGIVQRRAKIQCAIIAAIPAPECRAWKLQGVADRLADALRHLNAAITDADGFRTPKMMIARNLGSEALDSYLALVAEQREKS